MHENYERPNRWWPAAHSQAYAGDPNGTPEEQREYELARRNFLALMFCLMVGTAGLPHSAHPLLHLAHGGGRGPRWRGRCFHCLAVPERARPGGAGEVRGHAEPGGQQL